MLHGELSFVATLVQYFGSLFNISGSLYILLVLFNMLKILSTSLGLCIDRIGRAIYCSIWAIAKAIGLIIRQKISCLAFIFFTDIGLLMACSEQ